MKRELRTKSPQGKELDYKRKKAPIRERTAPLAPLSDIERKGKISFESNASRIHLKEAIAIQAWGGAPNACVHAAYYGMYHAATAILHINGGVGKTGHVPKSHEHVLQEFSKIAETIGDDAIDAAKLLNQARSARMTADYTGIESPNKVEIKECVDDACRFIEICVRLFNLPASEPSIPSI